MPDSPERLDVSLSRVHEHVDYLLTEVMRGESRNAPLYREMLVHVLQMAQEDRCRWESKIVAQTLREMIAAFRALEQFKDRRKVTVFGSARTPREHPLYAQARELGATLASRDLMVITGGGGGIMAAAHEGAGLDQSLGLNITLPFEQHANATIEGSEHLLSFHFFFVRKLFFIKEADALVLCPGGFGTLDEAMEVLTLIQTGKSPLVPIVLLDEPGGTYWQRALDFFREELGANGYILPKDLNLMHLTDSVQDAANVITAFYRNFQSTRWMKTQFAVRYRHLLTDAAIARLNEKYTALCLSGGFEQHALEAADDARTARTTEAVALTFTFTGRDQGRLKELISYINDPDNWAR
ncbi:LOG family protein [Pseudomonas sp. Marseille-QA0892]